MSGIVRILAPKNTRPILKIEIAEQDRAFLREGLPVQLKFTTRSATRPTRCATA